MVVSAHLRFLINHFVELWVLYAIVLALYAPTQSIEHIPKLLLAYFITVLVSLVSLAFFDVLRPDAKAVSVTQNKKRLYLTLAALTVFVAIISFPNFQKGVFNEAVILLPSLATVSTVLLLSVISHVMLITSNYKTWEQHKKNILVGIAVKFSGLWSAIAVFQILDLNFSLFWESVVMLSLVVVLFLIYEYAVLVAQIRIARSKRR